MDECYLNTDEKQSGRADNETEEIHMRRVTRVGKTRVQNTRKLGVNQGVKTGSASKNQNVVGASFTSQLGCDVNEDSVNQEVAGGPAHNCGSFKHPVPENNGAHLVEGLFSSSSTFCVCNCVCERSKSPLRCFWLMICTSTLRL